MLQAFIIGNIGADAKLQSTDGREFVTFRVAHNDRWTAQDGTEHNTSVWVDCIMNGRPNVLQYLVSGQLVYVAGRLSARVYSSAKDRCMKAGLTLNVERVELLGGRSAAVPARLYDLNGVQHDVAQYFNSDARAQLLIDRAGRQFVADDNGWLLPIEQCPEDVRQHYTQQAVQAAAQPAAQPAPSQPAADGAQAGQQKKATTKAK